MVAEQTEISLEAFRHKVVEPAVAEIFGKVVMLFKLILPELFGAKVKSWPDVVVMFGVVPVKVRSPLVVIAPLEIVPMLAKLPEASILWVPAVCNALEALIVLTAKVPAVPLSVKLKSVFGEISASLILKTPLLPAVASDKLVVLAV